VLASRQVILGLTPQATRLGPAGANSIDRTEGATSFFAPAFFPPAHFAPARHRVKVAIPKLHNTQPQRGDGMSDIDDAPIFIPLFHDLLS